MDFVPSRAQGHLLAASIRVLSHQKNRPPTAAEISDLLGLGRELVLHILRGLERGGVVRGIENPFALRFDIADHLAVEKLPEVSTGPDMGREIEDFHKKTEDRQKRIDRMMRESDPEVEARKKAAAIEKEFQRFRSKKGNSPFKQAQ